MQVLHILVRHHLPLEAFEAAVAFYEQLLDQPARLRLEPMPGQLRIAQVASMLLIGAGSELRERIESIRAAYLVEDLPGWAQVLPTKGAVIVEPISSGSTGSYMVVRHPDGLLVEYVEHREKHPRDRMY